MPAKLGARKTLCPATDQSERKRTSDTALPGPRVSLRVGVVFHTHVSAGPSQEFSGRSVRPRHVLRPPSSFTLRPSGPGGVYSPVNGAEIDPTSPPHTPQETVADSDGRVTDTKTSKRCVWMENEANDGEKASGDDGSSFYVHYRDSICFLRQTRRVPTLPID